MRLSPDPVDTIERYAELFALLDDPFADPPAVLVAAGLDAAGWQSVKERWQAQIGTDDSGALARRFGDAYAATLHRLAVSRSDGMAAESESGPAWRAEAAQVGRDVGETPPPLLAAPGDTLESSQPLPAPPLPFVHPEHAPGDTLEIGSVLPVPALPFRSPS